MRCFQSYAVQNMTVYSEIDFHQDVEFGTKLYDSASLRETKCLSHRIAAKVASPTVGTKIAHPLATFATRKLLARTLLRLCFAKLLVLLVGGPDNFVAGASRAHPTRPLRGGRIALVGQPDRLRRQANVFCAPRRSDGVSRSGCGHWRSRASNACCPRRT